MTLLARRFPATLQFPLLTPGPGPFDMLHEPGVHPLHKEQKISRVHEKMQLPVSLMMREGEAFSAIELLAHFAEDRRPSLVALGTEGGDRHLRKT